MEQLEKFKTEIFALLSVVVGFLIGKRKSNAEAANSEADAGKKKAEEEQIRIQTMVKLQNDFIELNAKFEVLYDASELRRNANTTEQQRLAQAQSDLAARNSKLADDLHTVTHANFERELAYTNRIAELERKLDSQSMRVETIEKKTGSLESKMPAHTT